MHFSTRIVHPLTYDWSYHNAVIECLPGRCRGPICLPELTEDVPGQEETWSSNHP